MGTRIELRQAVKGDAEFVWRVNNDPTVRARSVRDQPIPLNQHYQWFEETIKNPYQRLYIIVVGEVECGVLRFDLDSENPRAWVSIALSPNARGRRIGTQVVRIASTQMMESSRIKEILAEIRCDNVASRKAFERAGYQRVGQTEKEGVVLEVFSYKRDGQS